MATVLVVEPDPSVGDLLQETLQLVGRQATVVRSTDEALALAAEHRFDLIITDPGQPTFGDETAIWQPVSQLRHVAPSTPIIVCTSYNRAATVAPADKGVDAIILKPFDIDDLLGQVARFSQP